MMQARIRSPEERIIVGLILMGCAKEELQSGSQ